jgi:hypothetical protein
MVGIGMKSAAHITATLGDVHTAVVTVPMTHQQVASLTLHRAAELVVESLVSAGIANRPEFSQGAMVTIQSVRLGKGRRRAELQILDRARYEEARRLELVLPGERRRARRVARCRSVLDLASRLLPAEARHDAFDEWVDEIESAACDGRPITRRTASIIFRSIPYAAWRSRRPSRMRRGGV